MIIVIIIFMFDFFKTKPEQISRHEENQKIIDFGIQRGDNPEKEHLIELAFLGNWNKMNLLKDKLLKEGYEQVLGQTDTMLVMSKGFRLNLEEVNNLTDKMEALAKEYGVEFDGWSTYPVK